MSKNTKKIVIYSDFDNVMQNWVYQFRKWLKDKYNFKTSKPYRYGNKYLNDKITHEMTEQFNKYLCYNDVLRPSDLQNLTCNYKMIIITKRDNKKYNLKYITNFLAKFNIKADKIIFARDLKIKYIPIKDNIVFIDDDPKELNAAVEKGLKHVLNYRRCWNKNAKGFAVRSWKDINNYIEQIS